ncbi:MAG: TylF/MycF/NovP-related O-methyltransferase, partial [Geminicoccaceae bacterium]
RALRQSRLLRRAYNGLRSDNDLMQTRHIPENAFSASLRRELLELTCRMSQEKLGDYLEFGVFNGTSLSCAYQVLNELDMGNVRCFGFDSFEGLPQEAAHDDKGIWFPGQFACRIDVTRKLLSERNIDWERVTLIKGWFNDTLNDKTIECHRITSASVVMIDCDLYSSTARCLEFVAPLLTNNAVLIFDDWYSHDLADKNLGERKAFEEFIAEHSEFAAEQIQGYNEHSRIIRLRRQTDPGCPFC